MSGSMSEGTTVWSRVYDAPSLRRCVTPIACKVYTLCVDRSKALEKYAGPVMTRAVIIETAVEVFNGAPREPARLEAPTVLVPFSPSRALGGVRS